MTGAAFTPQPAGSEPGARSVMIGLSLIALVAIVVFFFVTQSPTTAVRSGPATSAASSPATPSQAAPAKS